MDKRLSRLRVFIVDDSVLVREKLTELFSILPGLEVCGVADNAAQAISEILADPVDAVVVDLDLSSGSGLDVLRAVKKAGAAPTVIILTIHPFHDYGPHCLEAGADYYFEKGNGFDDVLNRLEALSLRDSASPQDARSITNI